MDYSAYCDALELLTLARLDMKADRLDQALVKLKQGLKSEASGQQTSELLGELGRLYARLGLRERAREQFERFLELQPDAIQERFQLGLVHFEDGDRARAMPHWEQVLSHVPLHAPALYHVAISSAQDGKLERAWALCRTVLDKVEASNLYFEQSKELLKKIESDPAFKRAGAASDDAILTSSSMSRAQH